MGCALGTEAIEKRLDVLRLLHLCFDGLIFVQGNLFRDQHSKDLPTDLHQFMGHEIVLK